MGQYNHPVNFFPVAHDDGKNPSHILETLCHSFIKSPSTLSANTLHIVYYMFVCLCLLFVCMFSYIKQLLRFTYTTIALTELCCFRSKRRIGFEILYSHASHTQSSHTTQSSPNHHQQQTTQPSHTRRRSQTTCECACVHMVGMDFCAAADAHLFFGHAAKAEGNPIVLR